MSVAVQVTVVVPTGNDSGASFVTVGFESKTSAAVAVPRATAVSVPVASTVTSAGGVTVGGVVSKTVNDAWPRMAPWR